MLPKGLEKDAEYAQISSQQAADFETGVSVRVCVCVSTGQGEAQNGASPCAFQHVTLDRVTATVTHFHWPLPP